MSVAKQQPVARHRAAALPDHSPIRVTARPQHRGGVIPLSMVTWLVGARGRSGNEIGFGPNVSLAGVGLALATGVTIHSGGLHFPMNIAAASSRGGVRVSFLTGFTLH